MTIDISTTYVLRLTPQELRLVMSGLAGTMKPEWAEEAQQLQDAIFKARNNQARAAHAAILKLDE